MPPAVATTNSQKAAKSQEYINDSSSDAQSDASSDSGSQVSRGKKRKVETVRTLTENGKKKSRTGNVSQTISNDTKEPLSIPGYSPVKLDASDFVSDANEMFSDLEGKQVWHITVPASVPITSIERLDIPAALQGEPILQHRGVSYNMSASTNKDEHLLLPRGSAGRYSKAKVEIARNFCLREMTKQRESQQDAGSSPNGWKEAVANGTAGISNVEFYAKEIGHKKAPRQQPPGLLMRYQPYGGDRSNSRPYRLQQPDEDEDDEQEPAGSSGFSVPQIDNEDSQSTEVGSQTGKHSKKNKHSQSSSREQPHLSSDAMDVDRIPDGIVPSTPPAKLKKSKDGFASEKKRRHKERTEGR